LSSPTAASASGASSSATTTSSSVAAPATATGTATANTGAATLSTVTAKSGGDENKEEAVGVKKQDTAEEKKRVTGVEVETNQGKVEGKVMNVETVGDKKGATGTTESKTTDDTKTQKKDEFTGVKKEEAPAK